MFRCELTGEMSEPGESPEFLVVERRKKEYYGVKIRKRRGKKPPSGKKAKAKGRNKTPQRTGPIEKIGEGWEIVKQIKVRRKNYLKHVEEHGRAMPELPEEKGSVDNKPLYST